METTLNYNIMVWSRPTRWPRTYLHQQLKLNYMSAITHKSAEYVQHHPTRLFLETCQLLMDNTRINTFTGTGILTWQPDISEATHTRRLWPMHTHGCTLTLAITAHSEDGKIGSLVNIILTLSAEPVYGVESGLYEATMCDIRETQVTLNVRSTDWRQED